MKSAIQGKALPESFQIIPNAYHRNHFISVDISCKATRKSERSCIL
nr:MAG TPA: hypothetical protein [Caudoviricetes sp.]